MKRVVLATIFVLIMLCSCVTFYAQSVVDVTLCADEVKSGRLFDLTVCAKADELLCGGEFELSYDDSIIEYRGVSSDFFEVKAKAENSKVTVVFASAQGVSVTKGKELFSVKFKGLSIGQFDVNLKSLECINEELNNIPITFEKHTVTVSKSSVTIQSKSSKSKAKITTEKSEISEKTDEGITATPSAMAIAHNSTSKPILYGVCSALAVILLFILGVVFQRFVLNKSNKSDTKNEDE